MILLGASNLTRGIAPVVAAATHSWNAPVDVLAALGHGRSYGVESRVMARSLPGIRRCGLWHAWSQREPLPTAALVTDIGNDILYDLSVTQIASWVNECLGRLVDRCDRVVVTELPVASVSRMTATQFYALRSIIFPASRLSYERARHNVEQLNEQIVSLAAHHRAHLVKPRADWYGLDPIHIRSRDYSRAWREILASWSHEHALDSISWSWRDWLSLRLLRPEQRRLFGIVQRCEQPSLVLPDGTRISLY